jgi:hypothetical protein
MHIQVISNIVSVVLAAVLGGLASVRMLGGEYSPWPRYAGGALRALAALFLILPPTRVWGGLLAAAIAFFVVIEDLEHRRYAGAIPGMLLLAAIPLALASGPLS